jgi:hypothetical protein
MQWYTSPADSRAYNLGQQNIDVEDKHTLLVQLELGRRLCNNLLVERRAEAYQALYSL